ncbi:hypothetical protein PLEOSDRAFT_1102754 [Pleurotus ostreatus PC15]|uniref:Uncharacterized protein n=1 Tax=Pleurotus ostreatus (strain PC15) TaxID=1137138 RepID=A0A067NL78_PLEO1|nr:hypothetical protein PLEOSDRAFT_1102754 [Pleurotus ostreatus PC15]
MSAARNRTTDNVLANFKAILDIASSAPVPILGPVLSAATKVLAEVETARVLKESCIILAMRATSIVYSIYVGVMNQAPPSTISELNVISLSETLLDIANLMRQLSRVSWFMFLLKRFSIRQQIDIQTARLEDAFKSFQIKETLHNSSVLQSLSQRLQGNQDSEVIPSSQIEDDIDMNARGFNYGTLIRGRHNNKVIICKRYHYDDEDSLKEFLREKATWMVLSLGIPASFDIWDVHPPTIPIHTSYYQTVIKYSLPIQLHLILLTIAQYGNAALVFRQRLEQQSVGASFLNALSILRGVSSALRHIGTHFQLHPTELDEFAKVSNIMVDQQGSPVLGRNIVMKAPERGKPRKDQLDRLLGLFYMLVEQLFFDDQPVFPFECWKAVGECRPFAHLRPLLRLAAWDPCVDFSNMVQRILDLSDNLGALSPPSTVSFPTIRKRLLAVEGLQHFMYIRPRQAWAAKLFDIGYVRQEQFVRLVNIQDTSHLDNHTLAIIEDQVTLALPSVQDDDIVNLPGNITRYTFRNTDNASIQRRLNGRMLADSAGAIQLLLRLAPQVIREYGQGHGELRLSDLILVCGTIDYPSGAGITFQATPPEEFYFYELPVRSEPWGFWSLSAGLEGQSLDATYITSSIQSISFVQLEVEDFDA